MEKQTKLFKIEEYPNFLDNIELGYSDLIKELGKMKYFQPKKYIPGKSTREEEIVEVDFDKSMPLFSRCMDQYIVKYKKIPTESEYRDFYYTSNKYFFEQNNMTTDAFIKAIDNRCYRAYPSLIRDIMFGKFLQEKLPGYKIINNSVLDTLAEIDLLLVGKKHNWGIHLFTNTKRSMEYRNQKNDRQKLFFPNVVHIDLPINLNDCDIINNLKLYGEKQFKQLKNICANYENN